MRLRRMKRRNQTEKCRDQTATTPEEVREAQIRSSCIDDILFPERARVAHLRSRNRGQRPPCRIHRRLHIGFAVRCAHKHRLEL